jgi:GTP-binding protein EngB required for normal cell division/2-oxo-4-hydroxy-4-carboxy--5-ureidoimidazoline (OHCU) decarboxylase
MEPAINRLELASGMMAPTWEGAMIPPAQTNCKQQFLELAARLAAQYEISALSALLDSVRASAAQDEIAVAVLGRFKAGKSSFLNHFLGRDILPAGVVPVTAVVTRLRYGVRERAQVHHSDGRDREIPVEQAGAYISEKENPENRKQVELITIELPELRQFRGLTFVDTPGLDSVLSHNTQTSLDWLPNVGLALVAVSVDPPLSQSDLDLLKSLYQYTPKVAILLTKADLPSPRELAEVTEYVRSRLAREFTEPPRIFPYSVKPGFEPFRAALEAGLVDGTLQRAAEERDAILGRKLDTLLRECGEYLDLSLKAREMVESERQALKGQLLDENEIASEVKAAIRLLVQQTAAEARPIISRRFEAHQARLESTLFEALGREFPAWTRSLATMLSSFEGWLADALRDELTALSTRERSALLDPLEQVRKQAFRALQQFRDRLSERTMRTFGVPLRTTESEIHVAAPGAPDVRIGRVFDRNWELLSPVLPAWLVRAAVYRHFTNTISYLIYQNLSRLSTQWEESLQRALREVEKEAQRRLEELLRTVERMVWNGSDDRAPEIRADLERLQEARKCLATGCPFP